MQHRGHIIILRPDLDQNKFEALDHFQKHKADYEQLREKFTFINPKNYRGTGRNHFDGNPFYIDNGILQMWPETNLQTVDNLEARKLFTTYEEANTPQDAEDDLTFFSLEEMQNIYKLIDNKTDFEILEIIQNEEEMTDKTIGFDIGYIGGDFFSAIADTAIKPFGHPPDFDNMIDIVEHLKKLNDNVLFDNFKDAEMYRQTYLSKEWAEKEMYEGQITTIQIRTI